MIRIRHHPRHQQSHQPRWQFLLRYEHLAGVTVSNERRWRSILHISCLIERLIRHAGITAQVGNSVGTGTESALREAFGVIE